MNYYVNSVDAHPQMGMGAKYMFTCTRTPTANFIALASSTVFKIISHLQKNVMASVGGVIGLPIKQASKCISSILSQMISKMLETESFLEHYEQEASALFLRMEAGIAFKTNVY